MKADTIELIPVGKPTGPVTWQMSMNGAPPKGSGNYPAVDVPYNQTADITFTIRHPGSIKFASDAFCAQAGTAKPTSCDSQFSASGMGTTTLVVHDSNTAKGTYTYVINFEGAPQLDPIIKNGGNGIGGGFLHSLTAAEIVGIALLIIVLAFVARKIFMRRDKPTGP